MPKPNSPSQFDDPDHRCGDSGKRSKRILVREMDDAEMEVEHDGTTIQPNEKDWKNGDHLSLHSFDDEDFLNPVMDCAVQVIPPGSLRPDQETRPLWQRFNRQAIKASLELLQLDIEVTQDVMNTDAYLKEVPVVKSQRQGQVGAALRRCANEFRGRRLQKIQKDMLERILTEFEGLYEVMDSDHADHSDVDLHEKWQREIQKLHMACRAYRALTERIDQVCSSTPKINPSEEEKCTIQRFDLSETEITPVEDAMESPPLTPPTPEAILFNQQVPRALTPLNCVTVGVVSPSRPEAPPAVGYLPHSRLGPITNLTADATKLLQGGLEELQQKRRLAKGKRRPKRCRTSNHKSKRMTPKTTRRRRKRRMWERDEEELLKTRA
ncbi:uncharacterized protein LOC124468231 [Hypomesus transpacificus]|uniref:uncharacterized protein LOC124468231 n=1 Tax=Hypomesus transpacificus TaxID=137520 RepID=UPI001F088364|nr:uncharacterized protein LOC124468231 [Hypomesus transpacificus]XP_046876845.1 uncharacterized protein LOC124468231 [Hypomesus transpacificus]